jgi:hypothetical protein
VAEGRAKLIPALHSRDSISQETVTPAILSDFLLFPVLQIAEESSLDGGGRVHARRRKVRFAIDFEFSL